MPTESYWMENPNTPTFPPLGGDLEVDVVVIGGGNTGVTAAYLLKKEGLKVALIEKGRCGGVDTGHTSAHLTYVTDLRVTKLVERLGKDHATAVFDAGDAALQQIEKIIRDEKIECGFAKVPGYLHSSLEVEEEEEDGREMHEEAELARQLGYPASFVASVPLFRRPGVRFPNQARFHPLQYMGGLLRAFQGGGCHVYEGTEAGEFGDDPLSVTANGHKIKCDFIVIATDVPLQGLASTVGAALFQTKITPYTSYVIEARIPGKAAPDALFWDTSDPYYFFRLERRDGEDFAIFGGGDHKTGQEADPNAQFEKLETMLLRFLPKAQVEHRWSAQVIEALDGLPYIGEVTQDQFIATGFSGNGLTFGTIAAMMACDAAKGRNNPWSDLFDPSRKALSAAWHYLKENADYPYYMIKDRLARGESKTTRSVKRGEGRILNIEGKRTAVYRDDAGKAVKLSPVCTHMGCIVHWNPAEKTWDCPCHGSRFKATGEVFAGPAEKPLEPA